MPRMFAQISPTYEPPSTWRFWPETNPPWALQRYAQAAASSSGVLRRLVAPDDVGAMEAQVRMPGRARSGWSRGRARRSRARSEPSHPIEHGNEIVGTSENELGHEIDVGHHVEHEDEIA